MKRLAPIILAVSTLLGSVTALVKQIAEIKRDALFAWDNAGDQVAEVEKLKERIAALEAQQQVVCGK
jgi:cell division protein FtsB